MIGSRPRRSRLGWLTAVLAVVCLACVGALGVFLTKDVSGSPGDRVTSLFDVGDSPQKQAQDDSTERDAATSIASQFVSRLNTYGPHDLDSDNKMPGYQSRVEALMSAKFAASLSKSLALPEKTVSAAGYARVAELFSYGVASMDSDSADVLVAGDFTSSFPNPKAPKDTTKRITFPPTVFRFDVSMVKVDGSWKVDDLAPVTTGQAGGSFGSGTTSPSTTPSSTPTAPTAPSSHGPGATKSQTGSKTGTKTGSKTGTKTGSSTKARR